VQRKPERRRPPVSGGIGGNTAYIFKANPAESWKGARKSEKKEKGKRRDHPGEKSGTGVDDPVEANGHRFGKKIEGKRVPG